MGAFRSTLGRWNSFWNRFILSYLNLAAYFFGNVLVALVFNVALDLRQETLQFVFVEGNQEPIASHIATELNSLAANSSASFFCSQVNRFS